MGRHCGRAGLVLCALLGGLAAGAWSAQVQVERPVGAVIPHEGTDAQGWQRAGTGQVPLTYTVRNTGAAQLDVTNITAGNLLNVTVGSVAPTAFSLAPNETTAVEVRYTPTTDGLFGFDLTITSNAPDYAWTVSGDGDATPPTVPVPLTPTDGQWFNTTAVGFTWGASTDDGSGVRDYRARIFGPVSRDHYTANTYYNPSGLMEGAYYWHLRARDWVGNHSDYTADRWFYIDLTPPEDPTLSSPSHTVGVPSNNPDVQIQATGAVDPVSGGVSSGVAGFEVAWDQSATWSSAETVNRAADWTGGTFVATSDGDWWFHVATVDVAGNWTSTEHFGPFEIDTQEPEILSITSTTPDGYYNAGDINVTVRFSEPVILSGGTLDITLNTVPVRTVSIDPFGPSDTAAATYTIIAGDNACLLDAVAVAVALASGALLQDEAGNDAFIALPPVTIAAGSSIMVDTTVPVISGLSLPDSEIPVDPDDCTSSVDFSATVIDNCCIDADGGVRVIFEVLPDGSATLFGAVAIMFVSDQQLNVAGTIAVEELTESPVQVWVRIQATDCSGNEAVQAEAVATFADATAPVITWDVPLPGSPQYVSAGACSIIFPVEATVQDACCIDADNVTVDVDVTDATAVVSYTIQQESANTVRVVGEMTVYEITGSPAVFSFTISATDCSGNPAATLSDSVEIYDDTLPVITWAIPIPDSPQYVSADACTITFPVEATISDACCIDAGNVLISIDVTNATVVHNLTATRVVPTMVRVAGEITVSALTGSPAVFSFTISATDCSGNPAATLSDSVEIYDDTLPVITWAIPIPDSPQYVSADACTITFPVEATISDPCCMNAANVRIDVAVTNATLVHTVAATQVDPTTVRVAGEITVSALTGSPAVLSIDIDATDCSGNPAATLSDSVEIHDDTLPVISGLSLPGGVIAVDPEDCTATVEFSATVTDNCCMIAGSVTVAVELVPDYDTATLLFWSATAENETDQQVNVTGSFTVGELTGSPVRVRVRINATDCNGSAATEEVAVATFADSSAPVITWDVPLPASPQYVSAATCEITFTVEATVSDACCIDVANVTIDVAVTNATLVHTVTATQVDPITVLVAGGIIVSALTGCPAVLSIDITATDCSGNVAATLSGSVEIFDDTIPVIHDLMFTTDASYSERETDYYVDECCVTTVYFSARVTDNCCISPAGVIVDVTLPTGNAVLESIDVSLVDTTDRIVDITGSAVVRCLTSCPARVEVTVRARDCCGNWAVPQVTTTDEGLVWDTVNPIPRDDPRQDMIMDESAIIDPLVEVRLDGLGVYRLAVREDTPVRIDVLANDADNCSCRCDAGAHPFDPCGPCGACPGCCAALFIHEIVDQPLYGTATVEDSAGDCSGGSVIRYAPKLGYVGPDRFTYAIRDACGNVSDVVATVYLQVVHKVEMEDVFLVACSGEPTQFTVTAADLWVDSDPDEIWFTFSVVGGPEHGIVVGDPRQTTLTPPSTVDEGGQLVPTFDFVESSSISLTYISVAGYIGRDALRVRFEDPFGNAMTAHVDVQVVDCVAAGLTIPEVSIAQADVLVIIAPETFTIVVEEEWSSVLLVSLADGARHTGALDPVYDEEGGRYVVYLDTGQLPVGAYLLVLPLGNGERVEMRVAVGEAR